MNRDKVTITQPPATAPPRQPGSLDPCAAQVCLFVQSFGLGPVIHGSLCTLHSQLANITPLPQDNQKTQKVLLRCHFENREAIQIELHMYSGTGLKSYISGDLNA